jgi:hypothetical protein
MVSQRTFVLGSFLFLGAALLVGCSDPYAGRMAVSGGVKLVGQPLKEGSITFVPLDKQDTQGGAPIINGEYNIPRQSGLKPGKYLVQLTAGDGKTIDNPEEAAGPGGSTNIVSVDLIPPEWNIRSNQKVEVKSDGPNKFDFDIPKMNPRAKKR